MKLATPLALLLLAAAPALAEEQPVDLKAGPGQQVVESSCGACHSLDYIRMNSPFLTGDGWKAEVTKMRNAFHADISDTDAATIVNYLTTTYGPPAQ